MGREVISRSDAEARKRELRAAATATGPGGVVLGGTTPPAAEEPAADDYKDRLMKYIPGEVVSLFILLDGLVSNAPQGVPRAPLSWAVFVLLLVGTWIYLKRVQKVNKTQQLLIAAVAFAVWVFYLGGPFGTLSWYRDFNGQFYANFLLPVYTFGIGLYEAKK